jgi:hypothetical protein
MTQRPSTRTGAPRANGPRHLVPSVGTPTARPIGDVAVPLVVPEAALEPTRVARTAEAARAPSPPVRHLVPMAGTAAPPIVRAVEEVLGMAVMRLDYEPAMP